MKPQSDGLPCASRSCDCVTRREFLGFVAGAAGWSIFGDARFAGASPDHKLTPQELQSWFAALDGPAKRLEYRAGSNPRAAVPMGGIGCGNFYLHVSGALRDWLIFNNVNPVQVQDTFFAVRVRSGGEEVVRALQTETIAGLEGVQDTVLTGEYPFASISYRDGKLPVEVSMEALCPFLPLQSMDSALPGCMFLFRLSNAERTETDVTLAFAARNTSGYWSPGGNVNEDRSGRGLHALVMGLEAGTPSSVDRPVTIVTQAKGFDPPDRERPAGMAVRRVEGLSRAAEPIDLSGEGANVVWLEDPGGVTADGVRALREAVSKGAVLVISGAGAMLNAAGVSAALMRQSGVRPDVVVEDFESGNYAGWTLEGAAFGTAPQTGTLPNQNTVSGWGGKRFVNSYVEGDGPQGRILSSPFTVNRSYLKFLVGGGAHRGATCVNLLVDGKVVRTATGRDTEQLEPAFWDVSEFDGRQARIEIRDAASGAWGHILADDFVLSDLAHPVMDSECLEELRSLLPALAESAATTGAHESVPAGGFPGLGTPLSLASTIHLDGAVLAGDAEIAAVRSDGGHLVMRRKIGKGSVWLVLAPLAGNAEDAAEDRAQTLGALCALAGVRYSAPLGTLPSEGAFGELCIATDDPSGSVIPEWASYGDIFSSPPGVRRSGPSARGKTVNGAVNVSLRLKPGQERTVPFYLSWRFPNYHFNGRRLGNRYAQRWASALDAAVHLSKRRKHLYGVSDQFRRVMYDSTLPYWMIDCLTSQSSTIRTEVCIWTEQDAFAGYEGSGGCCPMNCTHVWGYEQTLAHLFPDLERRMRKADLKHQQREDGGINHRIELPLRDHPTGPGPFQDGHASGVLKAYREHLNSPDNGFLAEYYPNIRRAVDYLVVLDGPEPDGVLECQQWHTYDDQVTGPNSFVGSYYLAALRAGEEMARLAGDLESAERWRSIFERGRQNLTRLTWNGEYFFQNWPEYAQHIRQYGPGCLADQLIGQWWAHELGLGYILPERYVKKALASIYRYNWLADLSEFRHSQRVFADGHDKGLLCCTWPRGGRPEHPILYCDEVWTGVEYQVAAHMLREGMVREALAIVAGARERYDGRKRNPWDELECGGHYARAMSSWSLLLAASGFHYDGPKGSMSFEPVIRPERFKAAFTAAEGWGSFEQERDETGQMNRLDVNQGMLSLRALSVGLPAGKRLERGEAVIAGQMGGRVCQRGARAEAILGDTELRAGESLLLRLTLR